MEGTPHQVGAVIHDFMERQQQKRERVSDLMPPKPEQIGGVVLNGLGKFDAARHHAEANPHEYDTAAPVLPFGILDAEVIPVETGGIPMTRAFGIIVLMESSGYRDEAKLLETTCLQALRDGESEAATYSLALDHLFYVSRELYERIVPPRLPDTLY